MLVWRIAMKFKKISLVTVATLGLLVAGCSNGEDNNASMEEKLNYTINGIEPGSGTMLLANQALQDYENLNNWRLTESSTAAMLGELDKAFSNEEPIIFTGWNPHWMFAKYDLKYLDDPKKALGDIEQINTIVRKGFDQDFPNAYTIVDRFYWTSEDMESVMTDAQSSSFSEAAEKWVAEQSDKISEWTVDVERGNGEKIELISTPWETEDASSHVMQAILEQHGFEVEITPVDPAIMFQAIATGSGDVSLAPWLPITHGSFYEKHKDDFIDLGENLEGARIGFVVPTYMDVDSIEDLKAKE